MVGAEVPGERFLQVADLGAHPSLRQLREHLRVALPGDERLQHLPTRHPEHVGGDDRQFDLGVLQQLLRALLLPGSLMGEGALLHLLCRAQSGQTVAMRTRRSRPAPVARSAFVGFCFPPDVIVLAVRW